MSRDPEDGNIAIPMTLHKYLYAGGDPVNGIDPTGRDQILETGELDSGIALPALRSFIAANKGSLAAAACVLAGAGVAVYGAKTGSIPAQIVGILFGAACAIAALPWNVP